MASKVFYGFGALATLYGGAVLFRDYVVGTMYPGKEKLSGKTVIITGTTSGIGKETALELAKRDARVIMACRNMNECLKVRKNIAFESLNKNIYCKECDLSSQESIRKFAEEINMSEKQVDILINNAGIMYCPKNYTKEGIELQLGTNHMGPFLLTMLLLEKLKASAPSRIINLTTIGYGNGKINFDDLNSSENYDESKAFFQSKLATLLFTTELARRLKGTGVTCNAVYPGIVDTNITRHMSFSKSWFTSIVLKPFLNLFFKNPKQGAQTTIYAAVNEDIEKENGILFVNQRKEQLKENAIDPVVSKRMWDTSLKWTKLS